MRRLVIPFLVALVGAAVSRPALGSASDFEEALRQVERTRGRQFARVVVHREIARKDLRSILDREIDRGIDMPFADYVDVLRALRLLENSGEDPRSDLIELYESQVLAFYDPIEHVYYSIADAPKGIVIPEALSRAVVVHELTHALQDQAFDIGSVLERVRGNWDAELAVHSVIEGEASLVMLGAIAEAMGGTLDGLLANEGIESLLSQLVSLDDEAVGDSPRYFTATMTFPYVSGLRFVAEAYRRGGWPEVDAIYADLPTTTEQILNPSLYFGKNERIEPIEMPSHPSNGSDPLLDSTVGEFHWAFLLDDSAAAGWGGDRVTVMRSTDGSMEVRVESEWDTPEDAGEFSAAFEEFCRLQGISASVERTETRVLLSWTSLKTDSIAAAPVASGGATGTSPEKQERE